MKKILLVFSVLLSTMSCLAQESTFEPGTKVINAGIGFGTALYTGGGYTTGLPPVSVSFDMGIDMDVIEEGTVGIGGYVGVATAKFRYSNYWFGSNQSEYGWNYTYAVVGARGTYHYPLVDDLDTYGGAMLGMNIISYREVGDVPGNNSARSGAHLTGSLFIGGRYYFTESFAGFMELGYGVSYLNLGVAFKI